MLKYFNDDRKSNSNYYFFSKARRIHKINVRKCVIIFDEAHNIEQQCEDAASVMISSLDLAGCLEDITKIMQWMIESRSSVSSSTISGDDNEDNNIDADGKIISIVFVEVIGYYFSFNCYTRSNL
jgi:regulator of telomere elongation helicase 1